MLGGPSTADHWTLLEVLFFSTTWVGLALPFAAFAGGLKSGPQERSWQLVRSALVVSILSFFLLGYASPHLQYQAETRAGVDVETRFPNGPRTAHGLRALRSLVLENPAEEQSLSVEQPLRLPPNWITYRLHTLLVLPLFAILAAVLGALTGEATTGLSPPARINARWAIGLASGGLFFGAEALGGEWVRLDPSNPGVLGAWAALLVPVLELGILRLLLKRKQQGSTHSPAPASDV